MTFRWGDDEPQWQWLVDELRAGYQRCVRALQLALRRGGTP